MENKQTAVAWLLEKLIKGEFINSPDELIQQAKQMEKEQIINAYTIGSYDMAEKEFRPEKYYNETYNK